MPYWKDTFWLAHEEHFKLTFCLAADVTISEDLMVIIEVVSSEDPDEAG